ncbi:YceI-like domain-containing periplasmic protein [Campylobacter blaseri]|uniref:Polyisoprenoid-binding protein n=1 Tax=Campylobacter blaseri TaxID=2042961 RepID=A0A2P8R3J0_9BACT|nr:YceI family protein [Campylobacter blaseri]PSM53055.1 polyisoprenoid-binding protein [Campylobacter blaseri]PSM54522.1 polyisoprenoid-binding protein [Campylobacter blaseri]QKF85230.1 YceI-like domain-containing periplasmic protein [Campylobacter blaseri]
MDNSNFLTYDVDAAHSSLNFKIKHMQISNVKGNFNSFKGVLEFDETTKQFKSIKGEAEISSVNTNIKSRDEHIVSADFFDAEKFPTMTFEMKEFSQEDGEGVVKADLTIKGVTKPVEFKYELGGVSKNQDGKSLVGLTLEANINRTDFGIGEKSVAVGDKVSITIELEAVAR